VELQAINPYVAAACPVRRPLIDLIGAKWTMLVFGALKNGPLRFSELSQLVPGVTPKELTRTLRQLERSGILSRTVHPVVPPRVDYELTPLGLSLRQPIEMLLNWADENFAEYLAAQQRFDLDKTG
jgi:DNA-binding HxlR family transcriptional regulator